MILIPKWDNAFAAIQYLNIFLAETDNVEWGYNRNLC